MSVSEQQTNKTDKHPVCVKGKDVGDELSPLGMTVSADVSSNLIQKHSDQ